MAGSTERQKLSKICGNCDLEELKRYLESRPNAILSINEPVGSECQTTMHEAVGNSEILQCLLDHGGQANALSLGRVTPLHIAASFGDTESIKVLLDFHADVLLVNEFGRTPSDTAQIEEQKEASRLLKTAEIKSLAATNASWLEKVIKTIDINEDVEPNCFEDALEVAVSRNNHESTGILIINGANNIEQCLRTSIEDSDLSQSTALLWLCYAAKDNDIEMVQFTFEGINNITRDFQILNPECGILRREYFPENWTEEAKKRKLLDLREAVDSMNVKIPIRLAVMEDCYDIVKIMVFAKYCNAQNGDADWSGLRLENIQDSWVDEIQSYKNISFAINDLKKLPNNLILMKGLLRLDVSKNSLSHIPKEIFELPVLRNLNLSENKIENLPDVDEWSKSLKILNLQSNKLKSVPESIDQSELEDLNLSYNNLVEVQECICHIKSLSNLDISSNKDVTILPPHLAKLKRLVYLGIQNMEQIIDPAPSLRKTMAGLFQHLKARLRNSEAYYTMKLMLVGLANHGKTTLMHRLDGDYLFDNNLSTKGIDIKEVTISRQKSFVFKCWDFAGQEDYYATHQCFLSKRSLYLLVWKVTDRIEGVAAMKQWLDSLETRVPYSTVIIVGTHLDMISLDEIENGFEAEMNERIRDLVSTYKKIINPENAITMVACNAVDPELTELNSSFTSNQISSVENLQQIIYNVAENMTVTGKPGGPKIMGEMVPSSYLSLADAIERCRVELQENSQIPVLLKHDFEAMVKENAKNTTSDIFDPDDVNIASRFLNDIGIIIHYDDPNQHLNDLYFIDPPWLCDLMAKIVTVKESQNFIKDGMLYIKEIEFIIGKDEARFPQQLYPQYMRLLFRFHIGWRIDEHRILIPSQLPSNFPVEEVKSSEPQRVLHRLHVFSRVPHGFWSRFIGRFVLHLKDMLTVNTNANFRGTETPFYRAKERKEIDEMQKFDESTDLSFLFGNKYLRCWRKGILFSHQQLFLSVYPVPFDGSDFVIETRVSRNLFGYRALCYIVDHIRTLVNEWYPGLTGDDGSDPYINQYVRCPVCIENGLEQPHLFDVSDCLRHCAAHDYMPCPTQHIPDTVSLKELCPDVVFMDLSSYLRLNPLELRYDEKEDCLLGKGRYGKVYKGTYKGRVAAIKISNAVDGGESGLTDVIDNFYNMRQEVVMLSKVYHPNIITFLGVSVRPKLCSVIEYATQGNLRNLIKGDMDPIERIVIYRIGKQIANALSYLHEVDIVHRDLKPDNILMYSTNSVTDINVKLTDFGTASFLSCTGLKSLVGSPGFEAPELMVCLDEYTSKVDIYSFAMVLYELITRRRPFHWITEDIHFHIRHLVRKQKRPRFGDVECARFGFITLTDLMLMSWQHEATMRPTANDIFVQLKAPCFCLLYGKIPLGEIPYPNKLCFLPEQKRLWVSCADFSRCRFLVLDLMNGKIEAQFKSTGNSEINDYCYLDCMEIVDDNEVVMIFRARDYDFAAFYSIHDNTFLRSHDILITHFKILAITGQFVFIRLYEGTFARLSKSDFVSGNYKEMTELLYEKSDISVVAQCGSYLLVGVGKDVYKFRINSEEANKMKIVEITPFNDHVSNMIISPEGSLLFISFKGNSIISCYFTESMCLLGNINCSDVTQLLTPHLNAYNRRVTCLCIHSDTLWIGIGTGHVLIYEISPDSLPTFLTWIQPYKSEVSLMTVCNSPGSDMANFVVTVGEELNANCLSHNFDGLCKLTTTFPVDDSLPGVEQEENFDHGNESFLMIWEALPAATIRKLCLLN